MTAFWSSVFVVVMSGPAARLPDRLEGGNAPRKERPDDVLKQVPLRIEVVGVGSLVAVMRLGAAGDVDLSFRAHIDAGRIDDQRHVLVTLARLEDEDRSLARRDGKRDARHGCDTRPPRFQPR